MNSLKIHKLLWISIQGVIFFLLFCPACALWGQATEKMDLTPKDYHLWHHLLDPKISDNGNWASYLLHYQNAEDTLVLQHISNKQRYEFPNGSEPRFLGERWFVYKTAKALEIFDLEIHSKQQVPNIITYKVSPNNEYLFALSEKIANEKREKRLEILKLGSGNKRSIKNVQDFIPNENGNLLALIGKEDNSWSLKVVEVHNNKNFPITIYNTHNPISNIVWSPKNQIAFFEKSGREGSNRILWLNGVKRKLVPKVFDIKNRLDIDSTLQVYDHPLASLSFSEDGTKLFFQLKQLQDTSSVDNHGSSVQVWNAKDKLIYPVHEGNKGFFENPAFTVCWNLATDTTFPLGDDQSSKAILIKGSNYVYAHSLLDDMIANDESRAPTPIYVYNLIDGSKRLVMWRKPYMPIKVSPSGRNLIYFDESNWWIYNAINDKHTNITKNISSIFKNIEYDWSGVKPPYGLLGFTNDENKIIIYDKYDLWEISLNGATTKRLTRGKENNRIFRVVKSGEYIANGNGYLAPRVDLKKGIILKGETWNGDTGYYSLSDGGITKAIVEADAKVDWLRKAKNKDAYLYTIEKFDMPPKLMLVSTSHQAVELFRSNPHHENYKWGKAELVKYSTEKKDNLKGALFYPAGFNPQKMYPMVVFIYDKMSGTLHKYENPTLYTAADINITNFTSRGYFVFCPDIEYINNEVGKSALECVEAGVSAVLNKVPVSPLKIGLFGHSFGGYETSYIIGNSKMFAAAISESGIHDVKSFYFSMAWLWNLPQYTRFLNSQQRYSIPYFENPFIYEQNSPINYVASIRTPLLTITGGMDTNVNWEQSVQMYNAMRLLGKEHIMLIYPDEGHDFFGLENQIDMTYKRWQWFDHYLKDEPPMQWMLP